MRPAVRIALVVVGLAVAVYGVASLTGGWLGEAPPWQERLIVIDNHAGLGLSGIRSESAN